jgi:hypothetical protein
MSVAFSCDLCDGLEAGKPAQSINIKPALNAVFELEMCSACLVSFNDWRVSRAPIEDRPA